MVDKERELPITQTPEVVEIPPELEKAGVVPHPTSFTAKVTDDKGTNLVQPQGSGVGTITIPSDQQTLAAASKGSITDSITWFALFWLRMIKKALHFGWRVLVGEKK